MAETQQDLAHYQSDHDLLILLNERVTALTEAVSSKTGDHEARIRSLEQKQWIIAGAVLLAAFAAPLILKLFFHV